MAKAQKAGTAPIGSTTAPALPAADRPAGILTARKKKSTLPKLIEQYYAALKDLAHQNVMYEMGTRPAFHALLQAAGKQVGWTLIAEHEKKVKRSGITSDPNRADDEQYIVRLVGQVVRVSVETVGIVMGLPAEFA